MFSLTPNLKKTPQPITLSNNKADNQKPTVTKLMHGKYSPTTTLSKHTPMRAHTHAHLFTCWHTSLARAATSIIFVTTNTCFVVTNLWQAYVCCDKTHLLLRQKYVCCDKTSVATKECLCLSWQIFVATNIILSWQAYFCHDKHMFVSQTHVCHDKTCLLLWQKYACHDKTFVMTILCLSQQKWQLWQLPPMTDTHQ